ncbi:DNA polymerase [Pseudoduganella lutea]|uniref:DNA polymerase n=1 Tax=Pseudoduganella lutea TaxID=321985 RepID=A0A4P6L5F0_9BURK|nr:DNA polymerase [Pseudoduganella lutea]QBE66850.1 DNA polymerase [Pseudoduganella lutea]
MKLFDLESNGLLDTVTKVHCLVIKDLETQQIIRCVPAGFPMVAEATIEQGLEMLSKGPIGGHNVIKYDIPVLKKLYPTWRYDKATVFDTLTATRVIWSNIKDHDNGLLKKKQIPPNLWGSHSLEAWGYRLKLMKGEYKADYIAAAGEDYQPGDEWKSLSQEMLDYCVQDVVVTEALYLKILAKNYSLQCLELEHKIAWLMAKQERNGFPFDAPAGAALYAKLAQRRAELERELRDYFKFWYAADGRPVTPPKDRKVWHEDPEGGDTRRIKLKGQDAYYERGWYEHFIEGATYTKIKIVEFNPSSRDHIANRLISLYGWEPEVFTDGGKPQVDEDTVGHLTYPPVPLITEYLMVAKRISQLAEGKQAWLLVERNGKIHGSVNPNGAVTGRATHAYPNISQVPSSTSPYGPECRALFCVPPTWTLVGADASGLELRCLAHFMGRYDGGKYGDVILNGDIHWVNTLALGLFPQGTKRDKHNPDHEAARAIAKTFIYAFLYGAGDAKIGKIVGGGPEAGKRLKASFLKQTPALKYLIEAVKAAAKRGFLMGLDGREVHVRSSHAALNTLLQSAGAILCKQWLVMLEEELQARGLKNGWDGDYANVAWSHDETQIACRTPEIAQIVRETAEACVVKAGDHFNFRCPTAGESKIGTNWSETH